MNQQELDPNAQFIWLSACAPGQSLGDKLGRSDASHEGEFQPHAPIKPAAIGARFVINVAGHPCSGRPDEARTRLVGGAARRSAIGRYLRDGNSYPFRGSVVRREFDSCGRGQ